jgi:hypothetical protein
MGHQAGAVVSRTTIHGTRTFAHIVFVEELCMPGYTVFSIKGPLVSWPSDANDAT